MFLTGHAAVGVAAATALTKDPTMAFIIGLVSHYAADLVPHGDEEAGDWTKKGNEVKRLLGITLVDAAIWAAVLAAAFAAAGFSWTFLAAAVGSAVPDVMWGLEKTTGRRLFGPHGRFHTWNHNHFDVRMPLWTGLLLQGTVTAVLWIWVLS